MHSLFKCQRRPLALAATLTALAVIALVPTFAAGASAASTPRCTTSGLVVWVDTNGNGAAGSIFYTLQFTNLSGHTCTLSGYPGVSGVNLHGHRLGRAANRDNSTTPHLVTLKNGKTAKATLRIVDTGVFSPSVCGPVTAAGLRVFPPNQTASKIIPFPFSACSQRSGPVYLTVRAVT